MYKKDGSRLSLGLEEIKFIAYRLQNPADVVWLCYYARPEDKKPLSEFLDTYLGNRRIGL